MVSRVFRIKPKRVYWQTHIEAWQRSGLSQRAYWDGRRIYLHPFRRWLKMFEAEAGQKLERAEKRRKKRAKTLSADKRGKAVQAFWAMHAEAWLWSGLTASVYAKVHHLTRQTLVKWRDRLEAEPEGIDWRALLHPSARPRTNGGRISTGAKRRTKTGRLWVYARDQRAWGGPAPPAAVYLFAPDRKAERPAAHLEDFKGILHVDGYAGFETLTGDGDVVLAACWAHARRKFYDVAEATGSPVAAEALRRIGELYAIEAEARGRSAAHRLAARRSFSRPVVESLRAWLEAQLGRVSGRSALAEAIRYALSRWDGLTRFLKDGRVELDTNPVERAIRPVALGRKNHLFAGSDRGGKRWATVCSLIETAKMNGVEPYAYLKDVLQRMVQGHTVNPLDDLMPCAWKAENPIKT